MDRVSSSRKKVFAAFAGEEILRESGRLPHFALYPFAAANYEVRVFNSLRQRLTEFYKCREADLPEVARLTLSLANLKFTDHVPEDPRDFIYLFDRPLAAAKRLPWRKRVQIRFDLFSSYRLRAPVIAPYSVHPAQTEWLRPGHLVALRKSPRRMRVLFAGDSNGYVRNRIRYPGPKLPRVEILNTLRARIPDDVISLGSGQEIARLRDDGVVNKFVLSDSGTGIAPAQWLPTMARADFFLCAPGIVMPMCHNLVEAMSVGTIPIVSYPEWLQPNLKHLTNCIVFGDRDDLVAKIRMALSMGEPEIAALRANVVDYFDSYMRSEAVVRALEDREERNVTLLLYSEFNVARNSGRLNRNSILMKGVESDGLLRWVGKLADRHLDRRSLP